MSLALKKTNNAQPNPDKQRMLEEGQRNKMSKTWISGWAWQCVVSFLDCDVSLLYKISGVCRDWLCGLQKQATSLPQAPPLIASQLFSLKELLRLHPGARADTDRVNVAVAIAAHNAYTHALAINIGGTLRGKNPKALSENEEHALVTYRQDLPLLQQRESDMERGIAQMGEEEDGVLVSPSDQELNRQCIEILTHILQQETEFNTRPLSAGSFRHHDNLLDSLDRLLENVLDKLSQNNQRQRYRPIAIAKIIAYSDRALSLWLKDTKKNHPHLAERMDNVYQALTTTPSLSCPFTRWIIDNFCGSHLERSDSLRHIGLIIHTMAKYFVQNLLPVGTPLHTVQQLPRPLLERLEVSLKWLLLLSINKGRMVHLERLILVLDSLGKWKEKGDMLQLRYLMQKESQYNTGPQYFEPLFNIPIQEMIQTFIQEKNWDKAFLYLQFFTHNAGCEINSEYTIDPRVSILLGDIFLALGEDEFALNFYDHAERAVSEYYDIIRDTPDVSYPAFVAFPHKPPRTMVDLYRKVIEAVAQQGDYPAVVKYAQAGHWYVRRLDSPILYMRSMVPYFLAMEAMAQQKLGNSAHNILREASQQLTTVSEEEMSDDDTWESARKLQEETKALIANTKEAIDKATQRAPQIYW